MKNTTNDRIIIFDTTLRDGEQSPGASMNIEEKIQIALQLEKLGVDVIEAGFAASSPGDFEAIHQIAQRLTTTSVCSLARAVDSDIESAAKAIKPAKLKRIHTFIATSPIHMQYKLKLPPNEVINRAINAVKLAKSLCEDVEFSCEDALRSDIGFLKEILPAVVQAGASTINLPDTVGYRLPNEIGAFMGEIYAFLQDRVGDKALLSTHCHNDLGLAVANSIAAIQNGVRQVECTINGLGERAGNTALEEIVMILKTRKDLFAQDFAKKATKSNEQKISLDTRINTKEIYATSKLVADITGIRPQPNKAIVGKNAFAHESGIHQDGVLKNPQTYEIMRPSDIGIPSFSGLVLGKHSGRAAFRDKIKDLGFSLNDDEIQVAFEKFKQLCDSKKEVFDEDISAILREQSNHIPQIFSLNLLQVSACSSGKYCAAVSISKLESKNASKTSKESKHTKESKDSSEKDSKVSTIEVEYSDCALGNGAVDCVLKSIDRISCISGHLLEYKVESVSKGKDALAKVVVKVAFEEAKRAMIGHGIDIDTMRATAKAYISALNSYISMKEFLK